MKQIALMLIFISVHFFSPAQQQRSVEHYKALCRKHIYNDYKGMFKAPKGVLKYPYITPGSNEYATQLWDWDSWFTSIALEQIVSDLGDQKEMEEVKRYQQGCVLNFLEYQKYGWIPIMISHNSPPLNEFIPENPHAVNKHKPMLAQQAAFITKQNQGNAEWIRNHFSSLQVFVNHYINYQKHGPTGLYFWFDDTAIGGDNDLATFYRPEKSSANIFLNCLMYKELTDMVYLCGQLNMHEIGKFYAHEAIELKEAIQNHCWDEWTGFFYSCDLNLLPIKQPAQARSLHSGGPRTYDCLIQRILGWPGFMAMWAGIASPEQAERMLVHFNDTTTLNSKYGIRTLSRLEKMYDVRATGNPSSWLGPIWGISNYIVFKSMVDYGFENEAKEMAEKTIILFGKDFEKNGALHEYYLPDSGTPVLNKGFQNWNYLVVNMAAWLDGNKVVTE